MRRATAGVVLWVLTVGATLAASRFDWPNYDPTRPVTISGTVWAAEQVDGHVVIRINLNAGHPTDLWTVVLGTPKELEQAGLQLELKLGIPAEATVWPRKDGDRRHGRAQRISLNTSQSVVLRAD